MSYNNQGGGGRFGPGFSKGGSGGFRGGPGQPQIRIGGPLTPVLKYFIIINSGIFLLTILLFKTPEAQLQFFHIVGLVPATFFQDKAIWQLLTFNFFHANFGHVFFNMLAMYFFGGELENLFGKRRFIFFMAVCALGAGLSMLLTGINAPVVGASGIVYGVLLAYGITYPNRVVYLYFLLPIKVKYLVLIVGGIELFFSFGSGAGHGSQSKIAHLAHLGGMVFGGIYLYWDKIYMKVREKYYRQKLKSLQSKFKVVANDKENDNNDDGPTFH